MSFVFLKPEVKGAEATGGYPEELKAITRGPDGKDYVVEWKFVRTLTLPEGRRWVIYYPPEPDSLGRWGQVQNYRPWTSCWYSVWEGVGEQEKWMGCNGCVCGDDCTMPYDDPELVGNQAKPWAAAYYSNPLSLPLFPSKAQ